jgi:tRNA A-37 threonylcarbamoyl transferase component Bud32
MTELSACPKCGDRLPANAPAGICPKCLLAAGLESASEPQPDRSQTLEHSPPDAQPPDSRFFAPPVTELAGLFPQLEILELLGHGGMGAVYKARQIKLDRLVALKIIRPDAAHDHLFAERFNREAKALARLNHQNIVTVHEFGEVQSPDATGTQRLLYYFIMEYVDGSTLRQVLAAHSLQPTEALAIVPQICEALQFAHDEGVVHRDIKPENILLDKRGRVKIADFGLAKLTTRSPEEFTLTGTQQWVGTPRYMAPEQMEGSRAVDHRADIYSLGVVFYEMLTGEIPVGHFAPPSQKAAVDARLDQVVMRTLAPEPDRRYQRAQEVKTDVEHISSVAPRREADHPPVLAPDRHVPSPARLSRSAVTGVVLTGIGLLTGITAVYGVLEDPPPLDPVILLLFLATVVLALVAVVLGATALYQIRGSQGKLVGLELAFLSAVGLPLASMDGAIFGVLHALTTHLSTRWNVPPLALSLALSAILCAPLNYWILRGGWRWLSGQTARREAGRQDTRGELDEASEPVPAGFTLALAGLCAIGWVAAGALRNFGPAGLWAAIVVLMGIALLVVRWKLHYLTHLKDKLAGEPRGWRGFTVTVSAILFVVSMLALEQALVNLLDSYYYWRMGDVPGVQSLLQDGGALSGLGFSDELLNELDTRTRLHGRPSQRVFLTGLFSISTAVLLLYAAVATYLRAQQKPGQRSRHRRLACHVATLMWLTLPVALATFGAFESSRGWGLSPLNSRRSQTTVDDFAASVDRWAERNGYVRELNTYGSQSDCDYASYLLTPTSSLDRWQFRGRTLLRPKPSLCVTCLKQHTPLPNEALVLIEMPWVGIGSPEETQWEEITNSLNSAIATLNPPAEQ